MLVSNWVLFGTVEAYSLLLGICIFLLFQTRSLKSMIARLQTKMQELISDLKLTKAENQQLRASSSDSTSYQDHLDEKIQETRDHHATLGAGRDIVLDLAADTPAERLFCAYRFANLITEKEATSPPPEKTTNWGVIEEKFHQIIGLITSPSASELQDNSSIDDLLAEAQQKIENLEKYKTLFFQMEDSWQEAVDLAEEYYQQLSQMSVGESQQDSFDTLLNKYHNNMQQFGDGLAVASESIKTVTNTIEITKTDTRSQKELKQLRTVAAEQHQLISELQQRLSKAKTNTERESIIKDLQKDLERQVRFVTEAETCIQLMEKELDQANSEVQALERQLHMSEKSAPRISSLRKEIESLEQDKRHLQRNIKTLEKENHQLADQVQFSSAPTADMQMLNDELTAVKKNYTELETRYLALRMGEKN